MEKRNGSSMWILNRFVFSIVELFASEIAMDCRWAASLPISQACLLALGENHISDENLMDQELIKKCCCELIYLVWDFCQRSPTSDCQRMSNYAFNNSEMSHLSCDLIFFILMWAIGLDQLYAAGKLTKNLELINRLSKVRSVAFRLPFPLLLLQIRVEANVQTELRHKHVFRTEDVGNHFSTSRWQITRKHWRVEQIIIDEKRYLRQGRD